MRAAQQPAIALALFLIAQVVSASAATADQAPGTAAHTLQVVTGTGTSGLVVRTGPGLEFPVLAILPEGASVLVLHSPVSSGEIDWYAIQVTGADTVSGYSSATYLQPAASASPLDANRGLRIASAIVTAYANGSDGGAVSSRTASGVQTHWGTIAADLQLYPFGTRIKIDGFDDTVFVVEDTGGGMHGTIFDVWFPDVSAAVAFGTQRRGVTILQPGG